MRPHSASNFTSLDIIPDIHGQLDKLESLLSYLGYDRIDDSWRHPERKVLFLGDYIDRGSKVRGTLHLVKNMVERGEALALMGNHEFNAIAFHSTDSYGRPLREHSPKNIHQHQATLDDFAGHESELDSFIEWMKGLPMFLDLGSLRAVHACWCEKSISLLQGATLKDGNFLHRANTRGTPEYIATERVLKGPEITLPPSMEIADAEGNKRREMRIRWWGYGNEPLPVSEVFMPPGGSSVNELIPAEVFRGIPNYPVNSPPVFFGHYWMPPDRKKEPLTNSLCCLDYSAGKGGPLVAYRWNGEQILSGSSFFSVEEIEETERHKKEWAEKEKEIRARVSRENPDLIE